MFGRYALKYTRGTTYSTNQKHAEFLLKKHEPLFLKFSNDDSIYEDFCEFSSVVLKAIACSKNLEESNISSIMDRGYLKFKYDFKHTTIENLLPFFKEFEKFLENAFCKDEESQILRDKFIVLYNDLNQFYTLCINDKFTIENLNPCFLVKKDILVNQYFLLTHIESHPMEISQIIMSFLLILNVKIFVSPCEYYSFPTVMDVNLQNGKYYIEALVGDNKDKRYFGIVDKYGKVINDSSNPTITKLLFGPFFSGVLHHFGLPPIPSMAPFEQAITSLTPQEKGNITNSTLTNYELSRALRAVFVTFSTLKEAETFYLKYKKDIYPIWDNDYKGGNYLPVIDSERIKGKFTVRIPTATQRNGSLIRYTYEDFLKDSQANLPPLDQIKEIAAYVAPQMRK
jgi:hypothetical protein